MWFVEESDRTPSELLGEAKKIGTDFNFSKSSFVSFEYMFEKYL